MEETYFGQDYDYYLFWADELANKHPELCEIENETRLHIAVTHLIMDEGVNENYQEIAQILAGIIKKIN